MEKTTSKQQEESAEPISAGSRPLPQRESNYPLLALQRSVGNQAVVRLMESGKLQTKLRVSQPGDADEQEADRVAEQVVSQRSGPLLQRKCACSGGASCSKCAHDEDEEAIHRSVIGSALRSSPLSLQRSAIEAAENQPTPLIEERAPQQLTPPAPRSAAPRGIRLIVEDDAPSVAPGQMRKTPFLQKMRANVCATADAALAPVGRSSSSCPYVEQWLAFYLSQDSQHIERALHLYAPETASATHVEQYLFGVNARVRRAIIVWKRTGQITGVPPGVPLNPPQTGQPDALTRAAEQPGQSREPTGPAASSSRSTGVLFKRRSDSSSLDDGDADTIRARLGAGRSLDSSVKSKMEGAFGESFSNVRIHTEADAASLSSELNARAFTIGNDVAFGSSEYQPGTLVGDALIAHELAHVVQQGGGSGNAQAPSTHGVARESFEREADASAVHATVSLWSGAKSALRDFGHSALPRLKSGLQLQRCTKTSEGPIDAKRLTQARTNFRSKNDHLTGDELTKIESALSATTSDNLNLLIAFYDYYSNEKIKKMGKDEAEKATKNNQYAATDARGGTRLRPDLLSPGFSESKLGTLLIHEFTHTRHQDSVMGTGDDQEGDSYGIEYFFAERNHVADRAREIIRVMAVPTGVVLPILVPSFLSRFRFSYATMVGLYEIIDTGKSSRASSPFASLTIDQAKQLAAEMVARAADRRSKELENIVNWVKANLASFNVPPV